MMTVRRVLTRAESKNVTRGRLLEAAARLLMESGSATLSASAVARAAGVAQPTFYVHFAGKEQLLEILDAEQIGMLRERLRDARQRYLDSPDSETLREICRLPLETWLSLPDLLKLHQRELHQPGSPFGQKASELRDEVAADLIADLLRLGISARSGLERQRLQMIADALLAQTDALALGLIHGRYQSVETAVDVLAGFARSLLALRSEAAPPKPARPGRAR
jgi:AcrR family transcriptional regulator